MFNTATTMFQPNTELIREYAQEAMGRAQELARSQLDVGEKVCSEVLRELREYCEMPTSAEPTEMFKRWPKVLESIIRTTGEGTVTALRNSINFQNEQIQIFQHKVPELNKQIIERVLAPITAVGTTAFAAEGRMPRRDNGGKSQGSRGSKVA